MLLFGISLPSRAADNTDVAIRCDPAQVLGAESCAKCHERELAQWKVTPHFATFEALHRKPEAKAITKKLGLRSVKRNDLCVKCHYTQQKVDDRVRVVAGVSCESCHGAAQNWIKLHNDYGGPNATKQAESAEHRRQRLEASIAAGMNNPTNLYLVARQCLACHTTPNEELVNVGGHMPGSKEFELVAWSQGMIRHNFLRTDGAANATSTPEQLRVMFVVGIMADLEASLRATAGATTKATYGIASSQRAAALKRRLAEIDSLVDNAHVKQALQTAIDAPLKLNNRDVLVAAAESVGKAAHAFATEADGAALAALAALDHLLPTPEQYKELD